MGLLVVYLSALMLSIFDLQKNFRLDPAAPPILVRLLLYGPFVFAAAALAIVHFGGRRSRLTDRPALVVFALMVVMMLAGGIASTLDARELWFILVLTLLTSAGIYLGVAWESAVILNTSLVFFAINLYTRFYEYFWDAMPKSLFFIVGGAALILGGIWVERFRRRLVRQFGASLA